ncbi:MAG: hypothetical protein HUU20_25850 [Pirellulales bacterium]|nr:hypothetical protein [Pirellulales bacterium]
MASVGFQHGRETRARPIAALRWACAAGAVLLACTVLAPAQDIRTGVAPLGAGLTEKLAQKGSLTLHDAPLGESLLRISEIWGVNVIVGVPVDGRITATFQDAPLSEILDTVLLSNGYSYRPVGTSLVVLKIEDLGNWHAMFQTAAIPLRHANPTDCLESVRLLNSPRGKTQAIESAKVLLVVDFPEQVAAIRRFVEAMDTAAASARGPVGAAATEAIQVAQFKPQYATAITLKDSIQAVLSPNGKVAAVATENRLVVADLPFHLELARKVIEQLDVARPQVRITALIYDVGLKDMEELGINWHQLLKFNLDASGKPGTAVDLNTVTQIAAVPGSVSGVLTIANLSRNLDLTAVVQALQEASDSRLLANPNVTVLENEPATIAIVTEIPYQQLTQTQQGGDIGTTAFREAGVKLEVTPQIASDGTIQMLVTPSFSRLTGYTPGDQPQPIIDRREAKTMVRVAHGQTFVIGGLRQREDLNHETGIPFLKDIKFIGALFRSRKTEVRESELLVFIRPEIVLPSTVPSLREHAASTCTDDLLEQIPHCQMPCHSMPCRSVPCHSRALPAVECPSDSGPAPVCPPQPEWLPTPAASPEPSQPETGSAPQPASPLGLNQNGDEKVLLATGTTWSPAAIGPRAGVAVVRLPRVPMESEVEVASSQSSPGSKTPLR